MADLKERQRALIQKNLDGIISDSMLREQLEYIDTQLVTIAPLAVSPFDFNMRNLKEAFAVTKEYFNKPSVVWEKASLITKLKLQWFNFPRGIIFDGKDCRTTETAFIFKENEEPPPKLSCWVMLVGLEPLGVRPCRGILALSPISR